MRCLIAAIGLLISGFGAVAFAQTDPLSGQEYVEPMAVSRQTYLEFANFESPNRRVYRSFAVPIDPLQLKQCFDLSGESAIQDPKNIHATSGSKEEKWRLGRESRLRPTAIGGPMTGYFIYGDTNIGLTTEQQLPELPPRLIQRSLYASRSDENGAVATEAFRFDIEQVDKAIAWIQKVTEAHENLPNNSLIDATSPFSLDLAILDALKQLELPGTFVRPSKSRPPIRFTIFFQSDLADKSHVSRMLIVPSTSPLSIKSIPSRLSKPSMVIDRSGSWPIGLVEPAIFCADSELTKEFIAHDERGDISCAQYLHTLGTGDEKTIKSANDAMISKWLRFLSDRAKGPSSAEQILKSNESKSDFYLFLNRDYHQAGSDTIDTKQNSFNAKRLLQDHLYESLTRFFGGTSMPAEELVELRRNLAFLKQGASRIAPKYFAAAMDRRVVYAIDSDGGYFLNATQAAALAKELMDSNKLKLDLERSYAKDKSGRVKKTKSHAEGAYGEGNQDEKETRLIALGIEFADQFDPTKNKPVLPQPPPDPSTFRGRRVSAASIAIEMMSTPRTTGEVMAHGSIVAAIYGIDSGDQRMVDGLSYTVIETAKKLLAAAKRSPSYIRNQEEILRFQTERNTPEFKQSREYLDYLDQKVTWDAECKRIQQVWDSKMQELKGQLDSKRSDVKNYLKDLLDHSAKFIALEQRQSKLTLDARLNALKDASLETKTANYCESLLEIKASMVKRMIRE